SLLITLLLYCFFFNDPPTTESYTLSLHTLFRSEDGLRHADRRGNDEVVSLAAKIGMRIDANLEVQIGAAGPLALHAQRLAFFDRSEEHTSELQSRGHLVCRLLLEKKKVQY